MDLVHCWPSYSETYFILSISSLYGFIIVNSKFNSTLYVLSSSDILQFLQSIISPLLWIGQMINRTQAPSTFFSFHILFINWSICVVIVFPPSLKSSVVSYLLLELSQVLSILMTNYISSFVVSFKCCPADIIRWFLNSSDVNLFRSFSNNSLNFSTTFDPSIISVLFVRCRMVVLGLWTIFISLYQPKDNFAFVL